jgi:nucleotide-binding universal stress UspA family protein
MLLSGDAVGHLAQKILDDTVKLGLDEAPDVDVTTVVASRPPALALLSESEDAQLLVVGSRGHGGFPTLALGSVSHQCLQHAACSVAVVRADQLPSTG